MKKLMLSVAASSVLAFAISACSHSLTGPSSPPAPKGHGSINGKAGGGCLPEVVFQSKQIENTCLYDSAEKCEAQKAAFYKQYPDVDCKYQENGAIVSIKAPTPTPAPGDGQSTGGDICSQRAAAMDALQKEGQSTYEAAVHAGFNGQTPPTSANLVSELATFDQTYAGATCSGQTNQDFDAEIRRYIEEIDQLQ